MTDDRSLERAARRWLEEGPTRAPEHAVEAALARIETTPQERDWSLPIGDLWIHLTGRTVTALAAAIVILVGGVLLLRPAPGPGPATSPSPSPTSSATPGPSSSSISSGAEVPPVLTATFTSPRHGYTVQYPGDWTATAATAGWDAGVVNQWGSPALDELRGSTARFVGASQLLPIDVMSDQWLATYGVGACVGPPASWPSVPIGTATGLIDADGCIAPGAPYGKGGRLFDAVVVVGGRAYNFAMDGELSRADFVAFLATVTFEPASAVDPTSSP
jgi:hypothetical protein